MWLVSQRAEGHAVSELAAELGIAPATALRWSNGAPGKRAMVPVRVISAPPSARMVSVVSPAGFRIDGVTLPEAAALLRELG